MAGLSTDSDTLTQELKMAAKVGRNFIFSPGSKPEESYVALSKKKIPPATRGAAKKASGSPKVFMGACVKEGPILVFQTKDPVSPALTLKLKASVKALTRYRGKLELRENPNLVETEFGDEEEAEQKKNDLLAQIALRKKSAETCKALLEKAAPPKKGELLKIFAEAERLMAVGDVESLEKSINYYDAGITQSKKAVAAMKPAAKPKDAPVDLESQWAPKLKEAMAAFQVAKKSSAKEGGFDKAKLKQVAGLMKAAQSQHKSGDTEQALAVLAKLTQALEAGLPKESSGAQAAKIGAEKVKGAERESEAYEKGVAVEDLPTERETDTTEEEAEKLAEELRLSRQIRRDELVGALPKGFDEAAIRKIMDQHDNAVVADTKAFGGKDWIDDLLKTTKEERVAIAKVATTKQDDARRKLVGARLAKVKKAMDDALGRKKRLIDALKGVPQDQLDDKQKKLVLAAHALVGQVTAHIPDDFLMNADKFLARVAALSATGKEKAQLLKTAQKPFDQETQTRHKDAFSGAIDPKTLKSDWERHDFYFDQLTEAPTAPQLNAMAVVADEIIAKGQAILDAGGKFADVRKSITHIPEAWWPPRLVEQMQAWRKTERELHKEAVREGAAKAKPDPKAILDYVLLAWGGVTAWTEQPKAMEAIKTYIETAEKGYELGTGWKEALQKADFSNFTKKDASEAMDKILGTGATLIGVVNSLPKTNVPIPSESEFVTKVIPGLAIAAAGINLFLALKKLAEHSVTTAQTTGLRKEVLRQLAKGELEDGGAFVGAIDNELGARSRQLTKDGLEVTTSSIELAGAIGEVSGMGAPAGLALKIVGKGISYGGKLVFTGIEWGLAKRAMGLIEEARAGNPIARIQIMEDCGRYAKMYIAILVQEENPLARKFIEQRGIEEGDLDDATSLKILREAMLSSAEQADETEDSGIVQTGKAIVDKIAEMKKSMRSKESWLYDPDWRCTIEHSFARSTWDNAKAEGIKKGLYHDDTGIGRALDAVKSAKESYHDQTGEPQKAAGLVLRDAYAKVSELIGQYTPMTSPQQKDGEQGTSKPATPGPHAGMTAWCVALRGKVMWAYDEHIKAMSKEGHLNLKWTPPKTDANWATEWKANFKDARAKAGLGSEDRGLQAHLDAVEKGKTALESARGEADDAKKAYDKAQNPGMLKALKSKNQARLTASIKLRDSLGAAAKAANGLFTDHAELPGMRDYLLTIVRRAQALSQQVDKDLVSVPFDLPETGKLEAVRFSEDGWDEAWKAACAAGVVDEKAGDGGIKEKLAKKGKADTALEKAKAKGDLKGTLAARRDAQLAVGELLLACGQFSVKQKDAAEALQRYVLFLANKARDYSSYLDTMRDSVDFKIVWGFTDKAFQSTYDAAIKKGAVPEASSDAGGVKSAIADWLKFEAEFGKAADGAKKRAAADKAVGALGKLQTAIGKLAGNDGYSQHPIMGEYVSWVRTQASARLDSGDIPSFLAGKNIDFKPGDFRWTDAEWQRVKADAIKAGVLPKGNTGLQKVLNALEKPWTKFSGDEAAMDKAELEKLQTAIAAVKSQAAAIGALVKHPGFSKYFAGAEKVATERTGKVAVQLKKR